MFTKSQLFLKDNKSLHHAYLITGDISENIIKLRKVIGDIIQADITTYPDYFLHFPPSFSVKDSRQLIEKQKTVSFGGGMRFFVIASYSYTPEAQNGLLKVLEEPIFGNHFFVLSTTEELLLPTLRSRLMHIRGEELSYGEIEGWCAQFVRSAVAERLFMIEKFLDVEGKDDDDKTVRQKTKVRDIFNQLEKILAERVLSDRDAKDVRPLSEIIRMKGYLNDTAPALRLILEYIAFVC